MFLDSSRRKEQHKEIISHVLNDRFKRKILHDIRIISNRSAVLEVLSRDLSSRYCRTRMSNQCGILLSLFNSDYKNRVHFEVSEPWGQVDTWTSLSASNNNDITTILIPHAVSFIGCCANCKIYLMFLEIPKLQLFVQPIYAHHKLGLLTLFLLVQY